MSDVSGKIVEVHFIVSNPEVFERGTVVEQLRTEGAGSSSSARWERMREGDGAVGLDGQPGEEGLQCFALNPPSTPSNNNNNNLHTIHPPKFDCFVRFLDPTSLCHSLAIRVRSRADHPSPPFDTSLRWWVWETFVLAL